MTLDAKALDEYPGSYEVIAGVQMTITRQGDHLAFALPRQAPVAMYAEAKDKFFVRVVDAAVTFDRNEQGQIVACVELLIVLAAYATVTLGRAVRHAF